MSGVFIVAAKRTPFGAFGGALANVSATQLGVHATKAALASLGTSDQAEAAAAAVDECYFGNVIQTGSDAAYLARHVALQSGCSVTTPSLTVNRLCGSGFETVIQAAQSIQLGNANVVIAGGTESMSQAPLVVDGQKVRFQAGVPLGKGLHLRDALWDGLTDAHAQTPMGMTAENLAQQYNISRQACDEYAVASQQKWHHANEAGLFQHEMAPIEVQQKKTTVTVDTDEHPRPQTTMDSVSKLKPVFIPETGVVTAANASGICDGAGSILVASEAACREHDWQPLARLASYSVTGCDPTIMGIGPVQAIQTALQRAGNLDLDRDVDRVEINEAFAAQTLACIQALGNLDPHKTNVHGGAISLGHPLGASGSRIVAHLANEFQYAPVEHKRFVGAACIGGGQGIAVVLERV